MRASENQAAANRIVLRAQKIVAAAEAKLPGIASIGKNDAWWRRLALAVPAVAFVAGLSIDRLTHPHRLDLLSLPLLALVAWNVAVYAGLIFRGVAAIARGRQAPVDPDAGRPDGPRHRSWPARLAAAWSARAGEGALMTGKHGPVQAAIARRFAASWWQATSALQARRAFAVIHLAAAAWGAGVAASILLRGLVVQYRVGWESTFLEAGQVHALLQVVLWPALALLPGQGFGPAEVAALRFSETNGGSTAAVIAAGAQGGARWALLYVVLLLAVVIAPRLILAGWQAIESRRAAARIDVGVGPNGSEYHRRLWSILFPARVVLRLEGGTPAIRDALSRWLRFAAGPACFTPSDAPAPKDGVALLLRTTEGDEMWLSEDAAADRADDRLSREAVAPRRRSGDERASSAATDAVEIDLPADGTSVAGLPLARLAAAWTREDEWLAAVERRVPSHAARGWTRLREGWARNAAARFDDAMASLALQLAAAAREREPIDTPPASVRNLIDPARRGDAHAARLAAIARLTDRLARSAALTRARFAALHGSMVDDGSACASVPATAIAVRPPPNGFVIAGALHAPQAGMAGAASGAAMGASIDLLAGGLTLGAAAAVGAILGGGAGLAAASVKNRSVDDGPGRVEVGLPLLLTLAEDGLTDYLRAAHAGRSSLVAAGLLPASAVDPAAWRSDVVAAVAHVEADLRAAFDAVRIGGPERRLADRLAIAARQILSRASLAP